MIIGLSIVGLTSHSVGILAADGDYLLDSGAIIFGLLAISVRSRKSKESKATAIAALVNVLLLLIFSMTVAGQALNRLISHAPHIHALPVMTVSFVAAIVMVLGAFILEGGEAGLHMKSVWLDTVADAVSAAAIGVTAAIIYLTNSFFWADSGVAILISIAISYQALKLLLEALHDLRI
jgi:Co/Zn/Cd efflux system component